MKPATATVKSMTDEALQAENLRLRRSIPKDQSLLDAIKRETKRRGKKASQQGSGNGKDDR